VSFGALAQISLNASDLTPKPGVYRYHSKFIEKKDTVLSDLIAKPTAGSNEIWDFSSLSLNDSLNVVVLDTGIVADSRINKAIKKFNWPASKFRHAGTFSTYDSNFNRIGSDSLVDGYFEHLIYGKNNTILRGIGNLTNSMLFYNDSVITMEFPMSIGKRRNNKFRRHVHFKPGRSAFGLFKGEYNWEVISEGKVIFNTDTIDSCILVKTVHLDTPNNAISSYQNKHDTIYTWYCKGHPLPVAEYVSTKYFKDLFQPYEIYKKGFRIRAFNTSPTFLKNEEYEEVKRVHVYPNPSSNILNVSSEEGVEYNRIELVSVQGRVYGFSNVKDILDISSLPPGMYLLKAYSNSKITAWTKLSIVR
jgi:hypothetical protein